MTILKGAKVAVLGATGMVATPVIRALAGDSDILALARFSNPKAKAQLEEIGVRTAVLDLADPDLSAVPDDVDYVVNFAVTHDPDFETALRTNAESLGLVMSHFRKAKAFLHCSTTGVYEPNGQHHMSEGDPLGDNHRVILPTYSISKIAAESVARLSARLYGLPTVIARLNVPYGEVMAWPTMHLEMILAGQPIGVLPGEESLYTPLHSDDIIRQVPRLLEVDSVPATTVNWAGPDTVSLQEWCRYLAKLVGKEAVFEDSQFALSSVATDTTRMEKLIGPAEVHWQDGMARMVAATHPEISLNNR